MSDAKHTPGPWWLAGKSQVRYGAGNRAGWVATVARQNRDANARLIAAAPDLLAALRAVLDRDMRNTCTHEETQRGGVIWEICDLCGAKWADDRGGKPEWKDPPEWTAACAALAKAEGREP
jgi:hypothetical protein